MVGPSRQSLALVSLLAVCSSHAFYLSSTKHAVRQPIAVHRHYAPIADIASAMQLALEGEAPQMADGSIFVAIGGGIFAILTAGIPVLFLNKEEASTKADKLTSLEDGIGSMEGMEIIDDPDAPMDGPGDDPPKRSASV